MRQFEQRNIAIGAARAQLRRLGYDPLTQSARQAFVVLDEMLATHPNTVAAIWYQKATDHQITLFRREWKRWQQNGWQSAYLPSKPVHQL